MKVMIVDETSEMSESIPTWLPQVANEFIEFADGGEGVAPNPDASRLGKPLTETDQP